MLEDVDGLELIRIAIEKDASDIHLTVGQRPYMRCLGKLQAMRSTSLTESFMTSLAARIFSDCQREKLAADRELDASWTYAGRRFRVHAYYQQGFPAMALRLLPGGEETAGSLEWMLTTENSEKTMDEKIDRIEHIAAEAVNLLQEQNRTKAVCGDLEKHAYSVNDGIRNAEIRNLHILSGI